MNEARGRLLAPAGLDIRDVLPIRLRKHVPGAKLVIHRIVAGGMFTHRQPWTPIHHAEGIALCGSNKRAWYGVREELLGRGFIKCDGEYEIGRKSLWYSLDDRLESSPINCSEPIGPGEWERLAEADRVRRERLVRPRPAVVDHLQNWVRKVEFDEESAERAIRGIADPASRRHAERIAEILSHGDDLTRSVGVCPYGRCHSVITQMHRELRHALRIEREPLAEIDIGSAQPLLLGVTVKQELASKEQSKAAREEERRRGDKQEAGAEALSHTLPVFAPTSADNLACRSAHVAIDLACALPSDLVDYLDACSSGSYYETLGDVLGMRCDSPSARDRVKRASCWLIMGEPPLGSPAWIRYSAKWPTLAGFLERIKRDDHRRAAWLLQRAESSLVIHGACGDLMRDRPDIPILTVHDAILTPARYVWDAASALRLPWERLGVTPKLKVTRPVDPCSRPDQEDLT
jgi:hypothetical protein